MTQPSGLLHVRRALISVSDKHGIVEFAHALADMGVEIISTGGTARTLQEAGVAVVPVSEVTGFPEILGDRVKTLHPAIHAGLLAVMDNPSHREEMQKHGIRPIDLVVVNLYPFEATVTRPDVTLSEAIENIDIGGPAMVRASAKNYRYTAVIVNPARYGPILEELRKHGGVGETLRFDLAREAFAHTARYDAEITRYLGSLEQHAGLPETLMITAGRQIPLRYGENPHQDGAFYSEGAPSFEKLHGKDLSYNNILDLSAACGLVAEFAEPAVVIVKHNNPCGVGIGSDLEDAYAKALATDVKSAFGGIVAVNRPMNGKTAGVMHELFLEVIAAPSFDTEALEILGKKRDRRLIRVPAGDGAIKLEVRSAMDGLLVQTRDRHPLTEQDLKVVTSRKPTDEEVRAMLFAWRVAAHVRSNAIVYTRADRTLGIGAGQMSRVDSARIAALKAADAGLALRGCAVASDAFFPFADGLLEAVRVGAAAVIQPGGSVRDAEVIRAADESGIVMALTGIRHFRH